MATKPGIMYLIPCPIGDGELSAALPAANLDIIRSLDYFVVEDLRSARRFISSLRLGITIDALEFAELNEHTPPEAVSAMAGPLLAGRSGGIISEAGVPGVADPGSELVAVCHARGIEVRPLVGPSSILLALMASGMNGQSFAFNGYLPVKPEERRKSIRFFERRAATERQTQLFIETPYRNTKLLEDLLSVCSPATRLCLACDVSGSGEYIRTLTIAQWKSLPMPDLHKKPTVFLIGV